MDHRYRLRPIRLQDERKATLHFRCDASTVEAVCHSQDSLIPLETRSSHTALALAHLCEALRRSCEILVRYIEQLRRPVS